MFVSAVYDRRKSLENKPNKTMRHLFTTLMGSIEQQNFEAFQIPGSESFRTGISKQMFDQVSNVLAPRLKRGYQATALCQLKQRSCEIYLWKLTFSDGGDDRLVRLSVKADRAVGLLID